MAWVGLRVRSWSQTHLRHNKKLLDGSASLCNLFCADWSGVSRRVLVVAVCLRLTWLNRGSMWPRVPGAHWGGPLLRPGLVFCALLLVAHLSEIIRNCEGPKG